MAGTNANHLGDPERFIEAYFATYPGTYFTGMVHAVIKMVITGSQVGWMMY
jgi:acyl-coenzyme A synthetase/AMP-(fatty) acid ligase